MKILLALLAAFTLSICSGCSDEAADILNFEPTPNTDTGDEESSVQLTLTDTYDQTRNGARLILNYDQSLHAFTGTVQNVTNQTLTRGSGRGASEQWNRTRSDNPYRSASRGNIAM